MFVSVANVRVQRRKKQWFAKVVIINSIKNDKAGTGIILLVYFFLYRRSSIVYNIFLCQSGKGIVCTVNLLQYNALVKPP